MHHCSSWLLVGTQLCVKSFHPYEHLCFKDKKFHKKHKNTPINPLYEHVCQKLYEDVCWKCLSSSQTLTSSTDALPSLYQINWYTLINLVLYISAALKHILNELFTFSTVPCIFRISYACLPWQIVRIFYEYCTEDPLPWDEMIMAMIRVVFWVSWMIIWGILLTVICLFLIIFWSCEWHI